MQKLTKEQADTIMREIRESPGKIILTSDISACGTLWDSAIYHVKNIIYKHTEKNFDFKMSLTDHDEGEIDIKFDNRDCTVQIALKDVTDEDDDCCEQVSLWLGKNELKMLANTINKIVEHLDEH